MAEPEKGAPVEGSESAAAASRTETPTVTDAQAETPEQKAERLQRKLDEANQLNASNKGKIEELNRLKAENNNRPPQPPNNGGQPTLDSYISDAEKDLAEARALRAQYPDDVIAKVSARNAELNVAQLHQRRAELLANQMYEAAKPVFGADKKFGSRADEIFRSGRAASAQDALTLARGESYTEPDAAAEAQREADRKAAEAAQKRPDSGGGGGARPTGKKTIPYSEYMASGDRKTMLEVERGEKEIDYTR